MIRTLRKIWAFSGSKKGVLAKALIASILNAVFESLQFGAIMIALQTILGNQIVSHPVFAISGIMLISILGKAATGFFSNQGMTEAGYYMCAEKRTHIADLMKYVPMGYFNKTSMGNITAVLTSVMGDIENTAPRSLILMFGGFIQAVIVSAALLFFDVRIGLVMLIGIVCFLFATSLYNKRVGKNAPQKQKAQTELVKNTMEFLGGISVIKSFGLKGRNSNIMRSVVRYSNYRIGNQFLFFWHNGFSRLFVNDCCCVYGICFSALGWKYGCSIGPDGCRYGAGRSS